MDASLRVEIFVADVARTLRFYERLGFEVTGRNDGPPRYAVMCLGTVRVGAAEAGPVDRLLRAVPTGTEGLLARSVTGSVVVG